MSRPSAAFCDRCGQALATAERSATPAASTPSIAEAASSSIAPEAERRQLTVMFCDLVGSTELSGRVDPEELREILSAVQEASGGVIHLYSGHIAQYLGDGLLIYFGYPRAHEDDPSRAVRAGLSILAEMSELQARLPHPVRMRIGIHTGPVVVGQVGAQDRLERLALGETPNVAARIQGCAGPNEVVISDATYRLVRGLFECEERGPKELKGLSTPITIYRVHGESTARSRFEVVEQVGLAPIVGREKEVELLSRLWESARAGKGQVALVSGEGGIGKSRLLREIKDHVLRTGGTRVEFRCSPYHKNSALHPVIQHLERLLELGREDPPRAKLDKLMSVLARYRFPREDTAPLLASLLSLPHPDGFPSLSSSPERQKQKTLQALVAWALEDAEKGAVCFTWEDLHWADPSTLEFLEVSLEQVPVARMLVLLSTRPEFSPPWRTRSYIQEIALERLGASQVEAMIQRITGGKRLPAEVARQLARKTDGVPLFVEELTVMVLESGLLNEVEGGYELKAPLPPLAIPATLHDSLMARLDRLDTVRELAQLAAALGREFSYELILAVSRLSEEDLRRSLDRLVKAGLLQQKGTIPQAEFHFKHALIRDTAYQSLLKSRRQRVHEQVARVLEEQFSDAMESQPEVLAHHYAEAGLIRRAIPHWQRAATKAVEHSANLEAIHHLTRALELLESLPDDDRRVRLELDLGTMLGSALMAARGYAAPEVKEAYAKAGALCRRLGDDRRLFNVLRGLWGFHIVRAELSTARELGEQCLDLAKRQRAPALSLWAQYVLGMSLFHLGEFDRAREHLEEGFALYDPEKGRGHRALQDPGVACLCYLGLTLWFLGYADRALARCTEALALARKLSHPFSQAYALSLAGVVRQFRREVAETAEHAEAAVVLSIDQSIPYWLAWGNVLRGRTLVEAGDAHRAIAEIRAGLQVFEKTGAQLARPLFLGFLAEAYASDGRIAEGRCTLRLALDEVSRTGERFYEAELVRLQGELMLRTDEIAQAAEESFERSAAIARAQNAKALELRAVTSLSRLWRKQGKAAQARSRMDELRAWFREGTGTKDLKEAAAILD